MAIEQERVSDDAFIPKWLWHEHLARFNFAAERVKGKRVIDCACGTGFGSSLFLGAGASSVLAFDVSEQTISKAILKYQASNLRFQVSSALNLPVPDKSADIFISLETIEHLEKDREFLTEIHRVLEPGGIFICSTPNRTVTNPGKALVNRPWNPFHIREYSEKEFFDLLRTEFESVMIYGQNPKKRWKVNLMKKIGKVLPFHGAVRINQALKLPHMALDKVEDHLVLDRKGDHDYEYLVAVCH